MNNIPEIGNCPYLSNEEESLEGSGPIEIYPDPKAGSVTYTFYEPEE